MIDKDEPVAIRLKNKLHSYITKDAANLVIAIPLADIESGHLIAVFGHTPDDDSSHLLLQYGDTKEPFARWCWPDKKTVPTVSVEQDSTMWRAAVQFA